MKCLVINGTEIKGCTYNLKELFLEELNPDEMVEFYLPKDGPDYCLGCKKCFLDDESKCPHYDKVSLIWQEIIKSDLIVFAYPVYALGAPGQIKSLLDHLAVHWFVHRPEPLLFNKTAVIITQSIGASNRNAQKDVKTSLEWLGIPRIKKIGFKMMEDIDWNEISHKRKSSFKSKLRIFAKGFKNIKPVKKSIKSNLYFLITKKLQEKTLKEMPFGKSLSADLQYWIEKGWINNK